VGAVVDAASVRGLMRALWITMLVACGASTPPPKRMFTPSDRDAVKAVLDAQATAWNKGDLDGYMNGYAKVEWLVFTSGGNVRRGWQETYDTFHKKYAQNPAAMGNLVFEILSIDSAGADGAVVLGNWILTNSPSDGRGVFSVILERRPDGWKVIHDHTSSAPP
jgi:ketosteroid isomerase-like protein